MEFFQHLFKEPTHLDEFVDLFVAVQFFLVLQAPVYDVPPVRVAPQKGFFANDDQMASGSCDGDVEPPTVFYESKVAGANAPEHDDVLLSALERVNGRHLDVFKRFIGAFKDKLLHKVHLGAVSENHAD